MLFEIFSNWIQDREIIQPVMMNIWETKHQTTDRKRKQIFLNLQNESNTKTFRLKNHRFVPSNCSYWLVALKFITLIWSNLKLISKPRVDLSNLIVVVAELSYILWFIVMIVSLDYFNPNFTKPSQQNMVQDDTNCLR